jgi:hypothetical protein
LRLKDSAVVLVDTCVKEPAMAAPSYAFDAARSLLNEADELLADARRINDIADRIKDTVVGNELKTEVRSLVERAKRISEFAQSLPKESERAFKKGY